MKKQSNFALVCSLICAAGSVWFALTELFSEEESAARRACRFFLWLAAAAVWTANLVLQLCEIKAAHAEDTNNLDQIEEDDFYD